VAYTLLVEQQDRQTLAEMQIVAFHGGEMPTLIGGRAALDAMLTSEPDVVSPTTADIREALGLPRAG
jgi:hypothetical protein